MLVEHSTTKVELTTATEIEAVTMPWPLDEFLAKQGLKSTQPDDRRRHARKYYRSAIELTFDGNLPAFPREKELVRTFCCDISRTGVGFLSDRELYPRETVTLKIEQLGERKVAVVRCRRLSEKCFEVGARFC